MFQAYGKRDGLGGCKPGRALDRGKYWRIAKFKMWIRGLAAIGGGILIFAFLVLVFGSPDCDTSESCREQRLDGAFGWLVRWFEPESETVASVSVKTKQIPAAKSPQPEKKSTQAPVSSLIQMSVDSLLPEEQYDILKWNLVGFRSGNVDSVRGEDSAEPKEGKLKLINGGFVELSGWAGHPAYGMRFRDVLISLCGKVVGRASVSTKRPDVGKAVHINLIQSGWSARLATDLLPRCKEQVLQVWGVAPIGFNIFSVIGKTKIIYDDMVRPDIWKFIAKTKRLTPAENGLAKLRSLEISASNLRLRKCGDAQCDVVGHIAKGAHQGYVLESVADWSLIQVGELVGWAHGKFLKVH